MHPGFQTVLIIAGVSEFLIVIKRTLQTMPLPVFEENMGQQVTIATIGSLLGIFVTIQIFFNIPLSQIRRSSENPCAVNPLGRLPILRKTFIPSIRIFVLFVEETMINLPVAHISNRLNRTVLMVVDHLLAMRQKSHQPQARHNSNSFGLLPPSESRDRAD